MKTLPAILLLLLAFSLPMHAADELPPTSRTEPVWQWSVPAPSIPDRRAFLWIAPGTKHVRGLVVAVHNMVEKALFERVEFRRACAENDLGILLVFSGHDRIGEDDKHPNPHRSALDIFLNPNYPKGDENPQGAGRDLQQVLDALADESGYRELRHAPLLPVGHSSAGSFVWHLYRWDESRIFAMMPFKTGIKNDGPQGIPIFNIESEWFDYGGASNNVSSKPSDIANQLRARGHGADSLFGLYIDVGAGHCNVSDDCLQLIGLFLKKVVTARIPASTPGDQPVALLPVKTASGWLLDPHTIGQPEGKAVAYADWPGDPKQGLWYLDQELATAVHDHVSAQSAKIPQQLGFVFDGQTHTEGGTFSFSPHYLDDAGTFRVEAQLISHLEKTDLYAPGTVLDTTPARIFYRVNSGALVQTGPNTFRIRPHAGPIVPQGNPWEPTIVAYTLGDATHRPAERPGHINGGILNTAGQAQTLDFPKIADQKSTALQPIELQATADSGLPVQFIPVSGPILIEGHTLRFTEIPVGAKYPIRVLVSAFQWGRPTDPKIQSAGPIMQEFFIQK